MVNFSPRKVREQYKHLFVDIASGIITVVPVPKVDSTRRHTAEGNFLLKDFLQTGSGEATSVSPHPQQTSLKQKHHFNPKTQW